MVDQRCGGLSRVEGAAGAAFSCNVSTAPLHTLAFCIQAQLA